jgi:hypothetical protein
MRGTSACANGRPIRASTRYFSSCNERDANDAQPCLGRVTPAHAPHQPPHQPKPTHANPSQRTHARGGTDLDEALQHLARGRALVGRFGRHVREDEHAAEAVVMHAPVRVRNRPESMVAAVTSDERPNWLAIHSKRCCCATILLIMRTAFTSSRAKCVDATIVPGSDADHHSGITVSGELSKGLGRSSSVAGRVNVYVWTSVCRSQRSVQVPARSAVKKVASACGGAT